MQLVAFAALTFWIGCSPPNRVVGDAPAMDARIGRCGDGILDPLTRPPLDFEQCDDGPANGASTSLCTAQCFDGTSPPFELYRMPLDFAPTQIIPIAFTPYLSGLAYTANDDRLIHAVPSVDYVNFEGTPPTTIVFGQSVPVALGSSMGLPVWVERDGVGGFKLFYGDLDPNRNPVTHEIPYPLVGGTTPHFITSPTLYAGILIDQSLTTHELRIAVMTLDLLGGANSVVFSTPATGSILGTTMSATFPDSVLGDTRFTSTQEIVQFFDDTNTFVAVGIDYLIANLESIASYSFRKIGSGAWPYRAVAGAGWIEQCAGTNWYGLISPAVTHPLPFAVLTDTGDVLVWQFSAGVDSEAIPPVLGHVAPGSTTIQALSFGAVGGVYVIEPTGRLVELADSDCLSMSSGSLRPQFWQFAPSITSSTRFGDRTVPLPGNGFRYFSADNYYYSQNPNGTND